MIKRLVLPMAALAVACCEAETIESIQARIDAVAKDGGGRVSIAPGDHFLKGPIRLRSGIDLHLEEGAQLVFDDEPSLYQPAVLSSWEGVECKTLSPLIYAFGCTNVMITGKGTIAPKMDNWRKWFSRPVGHMLATRQLYEWCSKQNVPPEERDVTKLKDSNVRPQLIMFNRCCNVILDGFKIRESPFWTIHLYLSRNCIVRNLDVYAHGHNNDGIDIEMTSNVLVENCSFDQGADAIVIKAGRNQDAWRLATPSENIEIRNCRIVDGHVLLGIGSEMSGGVRNVWLHDCTLESECFNLFYCKTNERRGGFIENIKMENVEAKKVKRALIGVDTDVFYQWKDFPTYEVKLTPIRGLTMRNIRAESANWFMRFRGDERLKIRDVTIENVSAQEIKEQNVIQNVENLVVDGKRVE